VRRRAILTLGCLLVVLGALTVVVSDDPGAQAPPTSTAAASVEYEPVPILMFHMGGTAAVRRLLRAGWEVDSHTVSHRDLTTLSAAAVKREIAGSRTRLRKLFGVAVDFFAYPGGRHDDDVIAAVKDAGYEAATTAQLGWARRDEDPFAMPRVRVDGGMSARAVLQRLRDTRAPRR